MKNTLRLLLQNSILQQQRMAAEVLRWKCKEFAPALSNFFPRWLQPYFPKNFRKSARMKLINSSNTNFKLLVLNLNRNYNYGVPTPVSHTKVIIWLRTDSDTWQVLIAWDPSCLKEEDGTTIGWRWLSKQMRKIVWSEESLLTPFLDKSPDFNWKCF